DNSGLRLPVVVGSCINLIAPVDPYWEALDEMRRRLGKRLTGAHPDLVLFSINVHSRPARIRMVPIEVKYRDHEVSGGELAAFLRQASALGELLQQLQVFPADTLWGTCVQAFLAQWLDHAFRLYADPGVHKIAVSQWRDWQQEVLHDLLGH